MEIFRERAREPLARSEMRDLLRILTKVAKRVKQIVRRDVGEAQSRARAVEREADDEPRRATRDPDLCVITCALTGVLANRKQCPGIPYTPVEIAEEAKRAYDAGAARRAHPRAQRRRLADVLARRRSRRSRRRSRKRCPILLNFSTGTILDDVTEQCTYIRESRPADRRPQHGHDELLEVLARSGRRSSSTWSSRTRTRRSSSCSRR